jgi:hypothetical protein
MTDTCLIRFAPIFEPERVLDPALTIPGRTLYQRGSLTLEGNAPPLLIDHDDARPVGLVRELVEFDDVDGTWIGALTTLHDAPGWIRRGTRASFAIATLERQMIGDTGASCAAS